MMRAIALLAAVALLGSGCSFLMMREPPPRQQQPLHVEPDCTQGRGIPTLDLLGAGAAAFTGLMLLLLVQIANEDDTENANRGALWVTGIFGGSTLLLGASSVSGYGTARRCRGAIQEFYAARAHMQPGDQPTQQLPSAVPGAERGSCRFAGPACDPGLVCASRFCVRPPGAAPINPHL
ncbi:MAG: hypothetical protein WKG01_32490 [Kofleriaceae bacterium]